MLFSEAFSWQAERATNAQGLWLLAFDFCLSTSTRFRTTGTGEVAGLWEISFWVGSSARRCGFPGPSKGPSERWDKRSPPGGAGQCEPPWAYKWFPGRLIRVLSSAPCLGLGGGVNLSSVDQRLAARFLRSPKRSHRTPDSAITKAKSAA